MEKADLLKWVSEPIHIKTYFQEFVSLLALRDQPTSPSQESENILVSENITHKSLISSFMGIPLNNNQFDELMNYCDEEKVNVPGETAPLVCSAASKRRALVDRFKIPPSHICNLATLDHVRRREYDDDKKVDMKYSASALVNAATFKAGKNDLTPYEDILIYIRVYEPYQHGDARVRRPRYFTEEFAVFGRQTLDVLRDKISCPTDLGTQGDLSENPDAEIEKRAKDMFKSGFFFIHDVFYNDFRDPNNIDYSVVIKQWAARKNIGPLSEASMADTKFEDLTLCFGYPYVYQHQGNCEHLLVFSEARLLHENDCCISKQYPLLVAVGPKKKHNCGLCSIHCARWMTMNNERLPIDPFYFCNQCFKSYNYKDGQKIGEFQAYELRQ